MEHEKKLAFIAKMTKMGLDHIQHMDLGGTTLGGPTSPTVASPTTSSTPGLTSDILGPVSDLNGVQNQFSASAAPIQAGTNAPQLNNAYAGAQGGINAQQGVVNATQPGTTQGLTSESALSGELASEAAGEGPNPAQAALAQSTGQNVAATTAEIAGARGGSQNVGLLARQAAQQGATTEQQAVGAAATLQAQQQLAAQQEAAQLAATQVGQGTGAVTTLNQEQQNEQNILQGANTATNNANVSMQGNINNVNAGISTANQNAAQTSLGGVLSGASSLTSLLAKGGTVCRMDKGGNVLDANARKHIAPHNFALPGGRYPIHDVAHARNALARVSQYGNPSEKKQVRAAVHRKYPSLGIKKMDDGGSVDFQATGAPSDDSSSSPSIEQAPEASPAKKQGGGGAGILAALLAKGGSVRDGYLNAKKMASGGNTGYMAPAPLVVNSSAPQSYAGQWVNSSVNPGSGPSIASAPTLPTPPQQSGTGAKIAGNLIKTYQKNKGSQSPAANSSSVPSADANAAINGAPGTINDLGQPTPQATYDVYQSLPDVPIAEYRGGLAAKGGGVKARDEKEKAKVSGDSLKNDKVPTMLSEGEEVIDRETLADPGPIGQMARMVAAHINRRNKRKAA
jgi:hypothetical protein